MVKTKFTELSKPLLVMIIITWLAIAALGTVFLPKETGEMREMFAFSQIIPILVAAFYFGQAGGLLVAFAASLVSGYLVIVNIENIDSIFVQRVMFQIISFNSVALLTSFLSDQAKEHRKKLTRQVDRLNALRAIDKAIISGGALNSTLYILLESLTRLLNVEAAAIFLFDPKTEQLHLSASLGFFGEYPRRALCNLGEGMIGQAAAEQQTIYHRNFEKIDEKFAIAVQGDGVMDYYAVPLFANDRLRGVLEVFDRAPRLDTEWRSYLETLAGQAAIAIAQSTLMSELRDANHELSEAYEETLKGWSRALNLRDRETDSHTQRVVEMSVQLATRMGLSAEKMIHFERGAILHDIGKMGIPDEILLKPGKLSEEEWTIMRKHPLYAQMLIAPINYLEPAITIPLYHHERWDGSGYPFGLHGGEIPLEARVFAIIDVWDALRSDRPYRKALSDEEAFAYIEEQSGRQFDPDVVRAFGEMLKKTS